MKSEIKCIDTFCVLYIVYIGYDVIQTQLNSSAMILILFLPFFILSIKTRIKCRTCKTTRSVSKTNVNRGRFEAPTRSRVKALFTSCGEHTFIFSYTGFWIWTATCGHLHATKIKIKKWGGVHIHFPYMRALVSC